MVVISVSQVVISQMNGKNYSSHSSHLFHIGKAKIKLSRGWITKGRESYSRSMQVYLVSFHHHISNHRTKSIHLKIQKLK